MLYQAYQTHTALTSPARMLGHWMAAMPLPGNRAGAPPQHFGRG